MFTGVSAFQMGLIHIIAGMGAGVFERYPCLRVSFGESGAGWLAYALHRMDFEFEDRFRDLMKLRPKRILSPSVQGDVPVRPDQRQAHRRDRRRCRLGALPVPEPLPSRLTGPVIFCFPERKLGYQSLA